MDKIRSSSDLKDLQSWFSRLINEPLHDGDMNRERLSETGVLGKVDSTILPNKFLKADERIEIYNQQYWYRLIAIMQDEFPVLRHLLKIDSFNELAIAYLQKHPSESYTLNHLANSFPNFVHQNYTELNAEIIKEAVDFEYAYIRAFDAVDQEEFSPESLNPKLVANLEDLPLSLQESVCLFELSSDFVSYRDAVWDDDEEEVFPTLQRQKNYQAIYRRLGNVSEAALEKAEFILLKEFEKSCSISQAIENVAEKLNPADLGNLQTWFKRWVDLGLFVQPKAA